MNNTTQTMPCPVCQTSIPFNVDQLLAGARFSCTTDECNTTISLASESKPLVNETMAKFKEISSRLSVSNQQS